MKILIDFFPILLFFGAYKMFNIYTATGVLMAATVVQMGLIYAIDRKLQAMHKITLVLILLFGTLTLVLQDDRFIKWKPTVLYWIFAAIILGATLFGFFVAFNILEASQPSLISRLAPAHARGAALGVYNTLQSLGLFAGGALGGLVLKAWGPTGVFAATSALALLWLLLGWAQVVPAPTPRRPAPPDAPGAQPRSPATR